jgi:hypothetical protein
MRISRRFSRSAAAGAAMALTALSMTACSGSSSGSSSAASSAAASSQSLANANENDVQVLNSLQLTTQELDSAFATDNKWQVWTGVDPSKILLKQAWACTQNMIDTKQKSLEPVTSYFQAGVLPGDPASAPTSSSSSNHGSTHKGPGSPTSSGSDSSAGGDGNPAHWVVSTAIAYQTADAAQAAVAGMGAVDSSTPAAKAVCGGPTDGATKEVIGGGIGEVGPSWDNSQGVFVFTDTQTHVTISVVAQRKGRYVVLTYTRGLAKADGGYYDLEPGLDTPAAADAATAVLGQLTAAVVGTGS